MSDKQINIAGVVGAALGVVFAGCLAAGGAAAQDFYKGKRVTLFVGYAPGGGYDTYARALARHLPAHIPGKPSIIVKNQPGAGSAKLGSYLYKSAPKDGREIGALGREIPTGTILKFQNVKFPAHELNWIGSLASGGTWCIAWHTAPIKTAQQMRETQFIVGGSTGSSPTVVTPVLLNNLLGTKIKVIAGYPGGAAMYLALERGEIQGRCAVSVSSINSSRPDWIREKKIRFLLEISLAEKRTMPGVPRITELATSGVDRAKLEVLLARDQWTRPYAVPPGVPAERVALLRSAFMKMAKSADFKAVMERQKVILDPMSGDEMTRRILHLRQTPEDVVKAAIEDFSRTDKTEMAKAVVPVVKSMGKITKVENGGRRVSFQGGKKKGKLNVSSSSTKVSIAGKKAKRSALKEGMACEFAYQGQAAKAILCK
jgi:tripartite-type tricarboxylate transporter receptor subunit TctC